MCTIHGFEWLKLRMLAICYLLKWSAWICHFVPLPPFSIHFSLCLLSASTTTTYSYSSFKSQFPHIHPLFWSIIPSLFSKFQSNYHHLILLFQWVTFQCMWDPWTKKLFLILHKPSTKPTSNQWALQIHYNAKKLTLTSKRFVVFPSLKYIFSKNENANKYK